MKSWLNVVFLTLQEMKYFDENLTKFVYLGVEYIVHH